jgi:ribosome-associated protein
VDTLDIAADIRIPLTEIRMTAVRSQGAGGQNVNKLATAIHCQFDSLNCTALPDSLKQRLLQMPDRRITDRGVINIKSQTFRSQARNRAAALSRLEELLRAALRCRKRRIATKPGKRIVQKRLQNKSRRGDLKRSRARISSD